jgi:hypothetical protein
MRNKLLGTWVTLITLYSCSAYGFWFMPSNSLHQITRQTGNLTPNILKLALVAFERAQQEGLVDKQILTIIDYSKPSTEKRLWVVDLQHKRVLFNTLVAHGKNSGLEKAQSFSNNFQSLASSLGVFLTGHTYVGHNGYSLVMQGLEQGINDKAQARHIVFHPASYVSRQFIERTGRVGRSWGCPALDPLVAPKLINTIKDGTLVFAYYPDQHWLHNSNYL